MAEEAAGGGSRILIICNKRKSNDEMEVSCIGSGVRWTGSQVPRYNA